MLCNISWRPYSDPPVAAGYEYATDGVHPNFTSVLIPAPLPGGDKDFVVEVGAQSFLLAASTIFDFSALAPVGVSSFRITDIDLGAR